MASSSSLLPGHCTRLLQQSIPFQSVHQTSRSAQCSFLPHRSKNSSLLKTPHIRNREALLRIRGEHSGRWNIRHDASGGRVFKVTAAGQNGATSQNGQSQNGAASQNGKLPPDTGFVNWMRKELNVARNSLRVSGRTTEKTKEERQKSSEEASTSGREKFVDSVFGDEDDWTIEMEEDWRFEQRGFDEQDLRIRDPGDDGGPLIVDLSPEEGRIQKEQAADIWSLEDWREPKKVKQGDWDIYDVLEEKVTLDESEMPKSKEDVAREYMEMLQRRKRRDLYKEYEPVEETERLQLPVTEYQGKDTFRENFDGLGESLENNMQIVYALIHSFCTELPFPLRLRFDERYLNYGTYFWTKLLDMDADERMKILDWIDHRHMDGLWYLGSFRYKTVSKRMYTHAAKLLPVRGVTRPFEPQVWVGKIQGAPPFLKNFHRVIWVAPNGKMYGRTVLLPKAEGWLRRFVDETFPLYFQVRQTEFVVATEENCDMVIEYVTDLSLLEGNIPEGYPKPVSPPKPFNDVLREYLRPIGPGLIVCQGWHEGASPDTAPKRFFKNSVMARIGKGTVKAF